MRRPLLAAALFFLLVMEILLRFGIFDRAQQGQVSVTSLPARQTVTVAGRVYQKDSEKIYLDIVYPISSAGILRQDNPYYDNLIGILQQETEVPLGTSVVVRGKFLPVSAASNPGEFDAKAYYQVYGIGGRLLEAEILKQGEGSWHIRETMYQLRKRLKTRLEKLLPSKEASLMCAMLLGDREDLDTEMKELYQRNGIVHILSISSLHITLVGMSIYRLLRKCRVPVLPSGIAGSVLLFFYGMMTGFSVSACRAIGMYLLRMLAIALGRTYDMPTAMGVLAAVLAAKNPYYLHHAGFLLSFSSMIGIGMVYPAMEKTTGKRRKRKAEEKKEKVIFRIMLQKITDGILSGCAITLTTLPIQLWFSYQVPVYAVVLNMMILPFVKVLMITGFLSCIPGLGGLSVIDYGILQGYEKLCRFFDVFPWHTWNPGKPQLWQLLLYYLFLFVAVELGKRYLFQKKGKLAALLFLPFLIGIIGYQPAGKNQIILLDVGQGDSIFMRTASGEAYLFDCGSSSRSRVGEYVLLPCLRYYGIQKLDAVFVSHPDADHINGIQELLQNSDNWGIRIGQLVLPAVSAKGKEEMLLQLGIPEMENPPPIAYLAAGENWQWGSADFLCLHPPADWEVTDSNEASLCIYGCFMEEKADRTEGTKGTTRRKQFDFLLTGDVEGKGEEALNRMLSEYKITAVDVLKAAHHGSKNATSKQFLEVTKPRVTLISAGRDNRYGHPAEETLKRLQENESILYQTMEHGAIFLQGGKKGFKIYGFQ